MALDPANYIDELSITDPTSSDLVSQGDDQIRTVKRAVYNCFPAADIRVNAIHTSSSAPTVSLAEGLVWIDTSGGDGAHVAKIYDGSSFITLPFSVETAQKVDVNDGTIDGTIIGGATPAAISGTTLSGSTSLALATGATVTGVDNGTIGTSATLLATQGAIKTYVDAQVGAADLDITTDSGTIDIDLDDDTLSVLGGSGLNSSATGTTVTIAGDDASTSAKGVASFSSSHFSVSSGAVSIATDSIDDTLIDFGTGANQVSTADVPEETNLYYTNTRADARIAAASVGDLDDVLITSIANDQVLRYSTITSKWENETSVTPDQLDTIGQLVAYNGGSGEEAFDMPGSANGKVLTADSTATYGFDWTEVADNAAAMALALGG